MSVAMDLGLARAAFYAEHRLCGEMDADVEDERFGYRVWMWCSTCGARLDRHFTEGDPIVPDS